VSGGARWGARARRALPGGASQQPDFAEAEFNLARSFEELGDLDGAVGAYERSLGFLRLR